MNNAILTNNNLLKVLLQFLLTKISCKVVQSYQSYVASFRKGGKFWHEFVAGAKRGGGGEGEKNAKEKIQPPFQFSFPLNPLPLSTAATQATLIAIKSQSL